MSLCGAQGRVSTSGLSSSPSPNRQWLGVTLGPVLRQPHPSDEVMRLAGGPPGQRAPGQAGGDSSVY